MKRGQYFTFWVDQGRPGVDNFQGLTISRLLNSVHSMIKNMFSNKRQTNKTKQQQQLQQQNSNIVIFQYKLIGL